MSLKSQVKTELRACLKSRRAAGQRELYECVAERLYGPASRIQIANNAAHAEVSRQVFRAVKTRDKKSATAETIRARRDPRNRMR